MIDRVLRTIDRFGMFSPGQSVGVAVSGGADSVCLLHMLHELAPKWNLRLRVVHVDHGIRGAASQADAEFVRSLAGSFALPFDLRQANVLSMADNLEQAARRVRQEFYAELLAGGAVDRIATGHTRSDQAETVLYRVIRGSAFTGLSGIRPVTQKGVVRPLLYCTRPQVETWLRARGIEWREDETNQDRTFVRNRLRFDLLPQLRREYNPQIDDALANLAELARDEEDYWRGEDDRVSPVVSIQKLTGHPAYARRLVRKIIEAVKGDLRNIDFDHIEAILDMARASNGHGRLQIPGVEIVRSFDWVRFVRAGSRSHRDPDFCVTLNPPQTVEVPGDGSAISFQVVDAEAHSAPPAACDSLLDELDWHRIVSLPAPAGRPAVLEVRNWRPGDHYRPIGERHEQKIKLLFQQARIPVWERWNWPVVTAGGQIVWTRKFGAATDLARGALTKTVLRIGDAKRSVT